MATFRVVIDFEPGSDPLRGWVSQEGKESRQSFEGWLDLTRLLATATRVSDRSEATAPWQVENGSEADGAP